MPITPDVIALARTVNTGLSTAQTVTFNAATTMIRVYATSQDVYFKWGTTAVTNANFDEIIPAGQVIDLKLPTQASVSTLYTACTLLERTASAQIVVIEK